MDASASTALTTALTGLSTDATSIMVAVIPIAFGVLALTALVPRGIRWFRRIARI